MMATLRGLLRPAPPAPPLDLPEGALRQRYRYWRVRQLYTTFVGYAIFYFVRKNIPVALPAIQGDLGVSKADLGAILTLHDLVYGLSKFANGVLGDRTNPRYFMAAGLALSALANVLFGMGAGLATLGLIWTLNGWFQGMGFPPCARVLSHWFSPKERGLMWGLWNTSHQVGAAVILVLAGALVKHHGWRAGFVVPAAIALLVSVLLAARLRDTPESLGLPPVERYTREPAATPVAPPKDREAFRRLLRARVFVNRVICPRSEATTA